MNKVLIKRVGPGSVFKFSLVGYLLFFVITMVFLGLVFLWLGSSASELLKGSVQNQSQLAQAVSTIAGSLLVTYFVIFVGGLISLPFYALFNTIGALIFNLVARLSGGIEIDLKERDEYTHPPGMEPKS